MAIMELDFGDEVTRGYAGPPGGGPVDLVRTCTGFGAWSLRAARYRWRNTVWTAAAGVAARREGFEGEAGGNGARGVGGCAQEIVYCVGTIGASGIMAGLRARQGASPVWR